VVAWQVDIACTVAPYLSVLLAFLKSKLNPFSENDPPENNPKDDPKLKMA
jgi:hypothetical protein